MPTGGAEVVPGHLRAGLDLAEHLERLGDHLGADPVTWDHREPHPPPPPVLWGQALI
jgi:hypothetical protein